MRVHVVAAAVSLFLIGVVWWDAFETVVLPRTVARRLRLTRFYFGFVWGGWSWMAGKVRTERRRERFLAIFGPLSLVGLAGVWAIGLVFGFGVLHWAAGSHLQPIGPSPLLDDLYMSGTTFFTLGLGDVHPVDGIDRLITVAEAGTGFGFLATVIAYFPVLYQAFSRRETQLTLLDAWAGSPPAGAEVLRRLAERGEIDRLDAFLKDWEYWCSEVLESHISYPAIAYFRSQHQHQSWVAALAAILDLSALIEVGIDHVPTWQAHVTFAIARHAAVDLMQVLRATPDQRMDRLAANGLEDLRRQLETAGLSPSRSAEADRRLARLRQSYEPFICGLAHELMMPLPALWHARHRHDNWETNQRRAADAHL
jgi:hypothetical protein